jgi:parallel beta-helix repeat protein
VAVKSISSVTLAFLSLCILLQPALATNDPPPAGGFVNGDWTVTDARSYSGVPITLYGDLVIRSGGSLTLSDVDLVMWLDSNGQHQIEVQAGGTLVVKSGSTVTCANPSLRYNFRIRAGAFATLGNSTIRNAGYTYDGCPADNNGIYVASGNVSMDSCTITDSVYGVYTENAAPRVSNCLFRSIGSYGVFASHGSPVITGDDFTATNVGVYGAGATPRISRCSFTASNYGVYLTEFAGGRVDNSTFKDNYYNGVDVNLYSNPTVQDCTFTHNGNSDWYYGGGIRYNSYSGGVCRRNSFASTDYGCGVACYDSASPWLDALTMDMYYRPAIYVDYDSSPRVTNSTISTASPWYGAVEVSDHGSADLSRCAVTSSNNVGVYSSGYGALSMANCTVRAPNSYGLYMTSSGSISARDCDIQARYYGAYGDRGRLDLLRCNLTSNEYTGVFCSYGSDFTLDRCTVTAYTYGIYVAYYNASVVLRDTWVEAKNYYGAVVIDGRLDLYSSNIYATRSYALYATDRGFVRSYNSTLTTGSQTESYVYLDTGGGCRLDFYNTLFDQYRVTFTEPTSVVNVYWFANIIVQWQTSSRAANASLSIVDAINRTVFDGAVDQKGERNGIILQEYSRTQLSWENYTKFEFTASKNGIRRSDKRDIRSNNQSVRLVLSDPDPPVVTIVQPPGNLYTNRSTVGFSGTAEDFASGIQSVEWSLDGGAWAPATGLGEWNFTLVLGDGKHTVRVRAFDVAGTSKVELVYVTVDTVISLELDGPADGALLDNGTVVVSGTAEPYCNVSTGGNSTVVDADGRFEFVLRLDDGPHDIAVTARDETGNTMTVVSHVVVDTVPPDLRLATPQNGTAVASPVVLFSGRTEPGARLYIGGNQYDPDPNGTFSAMVPLGEGQNVLEVRAVDAAGNVRNMTVRVLLDTVPPTLVIGSPGNGLLTNRPDLEITGLTDGPTVTVGNVTAAVTGGNFTAHIRLMEGLNRIEVSVQDAVGNVNSTLLSVTLDTAAPYLQLLTPVDGSTTNIASLTVSGVTEPGVAITVNGAAAATSNGLISHAVKLSSGSNFIVVRAVDAAGNVAQVNRTVTLDQVPPALSITSPAGGSRIPDSRVMVRGLTDAGSTVTVNGVSAQMERTGRFSAEISLSEGENSLVVTSVDPAGNPTTKILKVTRTGALSMSGTETPLILAGLVAGLVVGAVVGLLVGRRRKREQVVVLAPEEPEPGGYDVPEEPVPPPRSRPPVRVDLPPPEYARHDEAYHPPAPAENPTHYNPPLWEGRPGYGRPADEAYAPAPSEAHLPPVPAPETLPQADAEPVAPAPQEAPVPWEEEEARPRKKKAQDVDGALDDIMRRLKT